MKLDDLPKNNLFCPLPWIGAHIMPNGTFSYCCVQNQFDEDLKQAGNLREQTIQQVRNNEWSNKLRKDLINGIQHKSCRDCWNLENQNIPSLRQHYHNRWWRDKGYVDTFEFNSDGTLDDQNIIYWDVRQTNLCNMSCMMCGSDYSSIWNTDVLKSQGKPVPKGGVIDAVEISKDNILDIIKNNMDKTYKFYFAGGEPLISPMHWAILDELVERKLFNVELAYNTNLLKLDYKGKNAIDYWKKFKVVYVGCSIDAIGQRAEVVRTGTNWDTINNNFKKLDQELHSSKALNITTSNMTIGGLDETIAWAKSFKWNDNEHGLLLATNLVYYPQWLSINVLPRDIKEETWRKIKPALNSLENKQSLIQVEKELWKEIDPTNFRRLSMRFAKHIEWVSSIRNQDPDSVVLKGFPELWDWYSEYLIELKNLTYQEQVALQ